MAQCDLLFYVDTTSVSFVVAHIRPAYSWEKLEIEVGCTANAIIATGDVQS